MMKTIKIIMFCLMSCVYLQASIFNDVLSARLAGQQPPEPSYQNTFILSSYNQADLSNDLKVLFDSQANYISRAIAASSLDLEQLNSNEQNALIKWLGYTAPNDANAFSEQSELSLKNDLLVGFISGDTNSELVGQLMLFVVHDTTQSALWREYVLQHYVNFYEATWMDAEAGYLSDLRNAFQTVFANCLFENSPLCGTSIINLIDLCQSCPEFDEVLILQAAEVIAADVAARSESRISALQLIGELGDIDSTEIAANVLGEDPRPNPVVQLAALGALATHDQWHAGVTTSLESFLTSSTHGRLRSRARILLER